MPIRAKQADASQIYPSIARVARAMEFRMELHREEGGWQDDGREESVARLFHNLGDFVNALIRGDKREIMNEGIDTINMIWVLVENEAHGELDAVQDYVPLLEEIREKDHEQEYWESVRHRRREEQGPVAMPNLPESDKKARRYERLIEGDEPRNTAPKQPFYQSPVVVPNLGVLQPRKPRQKFETGDPVWVRQGDRWQEAEYAGFIPSGERPHTAILSSGESQVSRAFTDNEIRPRHVPEDKPVQKAEPCDDCGSEAAGEGS